MKNKSFSYTGAGINRENLPRLGVFFLVAFGVPFVIMEFFTTSSELFPVWPIWYFRGGFALGILVLLISFFLKKPSSKKGSLEEEEKSFTPQGEKDFSRPDQKSFSADNKEQE